MQILQRLHWVWAKSEAIGDERARLAVEKRRKNFFDRYNNKERAWQGAIGEVYLPHLFPQLELGQPYVSYEDDVKGTDLVHHMQSTKDTTMIYESGIEIKCNRFRHMYREFFKNVAEHEWKGHLSKVLIGTAINAAPKLATIFYLFGWMPMEDVSKYDVRHNPSKGITSPCYGIKVKDFKPMKLLFPYLEALSI